MAVCLLTTVLKWPWSVACGGRMNRLPMMFWGPIYSQVWASGGKWPRSPHSLSSERVNRHNESVMHVAKIVKTILLPLSPRLSRLECVLESTDF